jgi:hypothetical protein
MGVQVPRSFLDLLNSSRYLHQIFRLILDTQLYGIFLSLGNSRQFDKPTPDKPAIRNCDEMYPSMRRYRQRDLWKYGRLLRY